MVDHDREVGVAALELPKRRRLAILSPTASWKSTPSTIACTSPRSSKIDRRRPKAPSVERRGPLWERRRESAPQSIGTPAPPSLFPLPGPVLPESRWVTVRAFPSLDVTMAFSPFRSWLASWTPR